MIRWSGVLASLLVIITAWLLLRFLDSLVENLGKIFAERRLLLQKLSAFFRFGVYQVTILTVILLSFESSREVLAILGGTAATTLGWVAAAVLAVVAAIGFLVL